MLAVGLESILKLAEANVTALTLIHFPLGSNHLILVAFSLRVSHRQIIAIGVATRQIFYGSITRCLMWSKDLNGYLTEIHTYSSVF